MLRKTVVCDTGQQIKTIFKQLSIVLLHYQYNLKTLILEAPVHVKVLISECQNLMMFVSNQTHFIVIHS